MIAIILIAHAHIAKETKLAAEHILGKQCAFETMGVSDARVFKEEQVRLQQLIASVDMGQGVLVMVDVLGATPCNIAFAVANTKDDMAIVAGFNLPAVIKAIALRQEGVTLQTLAARSVTSGKQYMCLASSLHHFRIERQ